MMRTSRQTRGSGTWSLAGGRNVVGKIWKKEEKRSVQARAVRNLKQSVYLMKYLGWMFTCMQVFDEEANDVTPRPLYQPDPGSQTTVSRLLLDESFADHTAATGSFTGSSFRSEFGSSRQSIVNSVKEKKKTKETVKTEVTEDMLKQTVQVVLTETDSFSLLDIPTTRVSAGAGDAEAIKERNSRYAEVCRKQTENKSLEKSVQTFNGLTKNKCVQCSSRVMVDAATTVFNLDNPEQEETLNPVETPETKVTALSSLKGAEASGSSSDAQLDLQLLMMSEKFHHSVFVMERSILRNSFQPLLSTCRQLPLLKDPDGLCQQEGEEDEGEEEAPLSPALKRLWAFSSELSRGCRVSCMAWNKKNLDLLAVGFGDFDFSNKKPGLVLCWSLKNPLWPERVIHCGSAVTSLDFSASSPAQLAVGMCDGSIAIFNVQSPHIDTHVFSSNKCSNRHTGPVWQLKWNQQELSFTGVAKSESLFSVGEDGRFRQWSVVRGGLDCEELLKLRRRDTIQRMPALCFDFHPTDSNIYVMSTWEGHMHKRSCSNNQQVLATYKKHFSPVNCISWCPLNPDVFLSCSSDWTIQLWNQDSPDPVLGFSSTHRAVNDIKCSPKWASVFGALTEEQLEIWDLNASSQVPVIVQPSAPGVKMTSLLFASHINCIVVGDTCGQVTVYQLKHLGGKGIEQGNTINQQTDTRAPLSVGLVSPDLSHGTLADEGPQCAATASDP
ncbi:dynein axonemal intermediate chain 4 [Austrofundulus limnaeus]|uniref:Dynein axonemal intermediate chain 4 n=1 Tax=Austrofundulus limnaeus TaxID=52670 RepID=A0A2I4BNH2_AUSLI|nr:PREDICTED: WD repeat-containing protein 78 [Austrofundulus limnaeus]